MFLSVLLTNAQIREDLRGGLFYCEYMMTGLTVL